MNVFVITTNRGLWSVYATKELAEIDAKQIEGEENIQIHECCVITSLPKTVKEDEDDVQRRLSENGKESH